MGLDYLAKNPKSAWLTGVVKRRHRKRMSEEFPVTRTLKWAEYKGNALLGLNSNELIIRVALFEAFLKEIHRHVLRAKPRLLSLCKPNRPIPLKEIFREGFERFTAGEIDRQVREADRLNTKDKAKFFQRRLKPPWEKGIDLTRIDYLIKLRHNLVHCDHNTHVTDKDVEDARELLLKVAANCICAGAKIYSTHFAI